jgi:hypothetical protein
MEYAYDNGIISYYFKPEYSDIELAEIERNLYIQDAEQAQLPTSIGDSVPVRTASLCHHLTKMYAKIKSI